MEIQHKAFSADVKISNDDTRTVRAVISSINVDRAGDVLIPQGLNSKDFEANPVVLLMHSSWSLPVGKVTALKRNDTDVEAKIRFADRPEDYPEGEEWVPDTLFSLFKQGVLNAFSVGFIPLDSRAATSRDVTKYGEDCVQVINRWKLLELSVVPLPCHQDAVATAVSKGIVTQESADKLFKNDEKSAENAEKQAENATDVVEKQALVLASLPSVGDLNEKTVAELNALVDAVKAGTLTPDEARKEASMSAPPEQKPRRVVAEVDSPKPKTKRVVHHIVADAEIPAVDSQKLIEQAISKKRGRIFLLD